MDISPYLNFKGECAEAFAFYAKTFGGQITFMQTHGDSPMKDSVPPDWQDKIMHATLKVGDIVLCKVRGCEYLHLVKAIQGPRFQIGNNRGRINGWITATTIFGRCIRIEP